MDIRLYVDVKIGTIGKVPKIAVNDWDDHEQLARDFCKIYNLDSGAEEVLANVILSSMRSNNIPAKCDEYHSSEEDVFEYDESQLNHEIQAEISSVEKIFNAEGTTSHISLPAPPPERTRSPTHRRFDGPLMKLASLDDI
jgi:hypothetical protein